TDLADVGAGVGVDGFARRPVRDHREVGHVALGLAHELVAEVSGDGAELGDGVGDVAVVLVGLGVGDLAVPQAGGLGGADGGGLGGAGGGGLRGRAGGGADAQADANADEQGVT